MQEILAEVEIAIQVDPTCADAVLQRAHFRMWRNKAGEKPSIWSAGKKSVSSCSLHGLVLVKAGLQRGRSQEGLRCNKATEPSKTQRLCDQASRGKLTWRSFKKQ